MTLALLGLFGIALSTLLGVLGIFDKKRDVGVGLTRLEKIRLGLLIIAFIASSFLFVVDFVQKRRSSLAAEEVNRRLLMTVLRTLEPLTGATATGTIWFAGDDPLVAPYARRLMPIVERVDTALKNKDERSYNEALTTDLVAEPIDYSDRRKKSKFHFGMLEVKSGPFRPSLQTKDEYILANLTERGKVRVEVFCRHIPVNAPDLEGRLLEADFHLSIDLSSSRLSFDPAQEALAINFLGGKLSKTSERILSIRDLHGSQVFIIPENIDAYSPVPKLSQAMASKFQLSTGSGLHGETFDVKNLRSIAPAASAMMTGVLRKQGVSEADDALYPCAQATAAAEETTPPLH